MQKLLHNIKPLLLLLLLNIIGVAVIYLNGMQMENMVILCGIMCVISIATYVIITLCDLGDPYLFVIVSLLCSIGIIMQIRIQPSNGMKQMVLYLGGVVCFFIALFLYRAFRKKLRRYTLIYWGVSMALFLLTLILGVVTKGAKNWIKIGSLSVQPAEFIRILFVLSMAAIFTNARKSTSGKPKSKADDKERKKLRQIRLVIAAGMAFSNAMFLFLQREWGIALLFFAIYIAFLYIYGENKLFFGANMLLVLFAAFIGVKYMSHIQVRVDAWRDPFANPYGGGYQILQSLFAIGAGGFSGRGVGTGSPHVIPTVTSDFIFSAICEEMGVLGGVAIIMLYFLLVYRGFKIALSSTNDFNKAVAAGLSVMLGIQTFIIVGGVIKLIPLTGITLPFISYGGSSMTSTFLVVGILQAISGAKGEVTDEIE